ncbi:MAG: hypothetical protein JW881_12235 [Spirochaetales bacterium]|nr:hypothetical protein [Spirochaetales bacterium]
MKRFPLVLTVFMLTGSLFAGSPLQLAAGIKTGYVLSVSGSKYEIMGTTYESLQLLHDIVAGAYFDAEFVRIDIDWSMMLAGGWFMDGDEIDPYTDNFISFINATLLLKYPISLGGVKLWPAFGARYAFCIGYTLDGDNYLESDDTQLNDIYMCGGLGLDIPAGPLAITPFVLFHYNITPNPEKDIAIPGMTISWFDIEAGIGVAFLF